MVGFKKKRYQIFSSKEAFDALFSYKETVVHKTFHGEFLFVREGNSYFAFNSKCPHQGKPLTDCWIEDNQVVCPFHQFHFSMENGRGHGLYLDKHELEVGEQGVYLIKEAWSLF